MKIMIRSNLQKILDNKNISIRELSEKTGINRASLTQLAKNESKMIKFETLNKLVRFLNVTTSDILEPVSDISLDVYKQEVHLDQKTFNAKALFTDLATKEKYNINFVVSAKRLENVIVMTVYGSKKDKEQLLIHSEAMQSVIFGGKHSEAEQIQSIRDSSSKITQNKSKKRKINFPSFNKTMVKIDESKTIVLRPLAIRLSWLVLTDNEIGNMVGITKAESANIAKSIDLHFILNLSIPQPKTAINFNLPNYELKFTVGLKAVDLLNF